MNLLVASLTCYRYTGREWDGEANLYYYRNRWYDPQSGRFISEDPIGLSGGINLYAYVKNDPINSADPQGLWPSKGFWPFGGHVHQASAERVLDSRLTPEQLYWLQKGLYDADWKAGHQDVDESPAHAMTPGSSSQEDARKEANRLFKEYIDEARRDFSVYQLEAMYKLGYAMHIMQDATSPAHCGFQRWYGGGIEKLYHFSEEDFDPGAGSKLDTATELAYHYYRGRPIRGDVFSEVGCDCSRSHVIFLAL